MAYGHKDIPNRIEILSIEDPERDRIISDAEAKRLGLRWNRRKGLTKRLGFDPQQTNEEDDAEAVQQGTAMRQRLRDRLNHIPDIPDHFPPPEQPEPLRRRASSPENQAPRSYKRIRLELADSEEPENSTPNEIFNPSVSHIDSVEIPVPDGAAAHPLIINSDSEDDLPAPPSRTRHRTHNPFILEEAEEGDESDDDLSFPGRSHSLSDSNSDSNSDSDESFIIVDDYFE